MMQIGDDFICINCDAHQSYAPSDIRGGITEKEAQAVGWREIGSMHTWLCPMCSGNEHLLRRVFLGEEG